MTSEPAEPDAAAVFLYRNELADDKLHIHSLYVRLKVLTEAGKEYADVEIPYLGGNFWVRAIEGRTIHSDGTVVPFTGKPYEKMLEKTKTLKYEAKVFTLPDVQVGSILEYRYVLGYDDNWMYSPQWYVQQPLYVRKAHFEFLPSEHMLNDGHGGVIQGTLAYSPILPKGVEVKQPTRNSEGMAGTTGRLGTTYVLDIENVPSIPEEPFMPPIHSVSYRVLFYYTAAKTADEYWKDEGKYWSKDIDKFVNVGKLHDAVAGIVAPADSPREKARKIYDAVMKLDNTSFTREHSSAENKAEGIKTKTAADIWEAKRGDANQIAILFVGLARAAGLTAYVAQVTNRDQAIFLPAYLSRSQLDDDIAIVQLDGKEEFFDPGERYCGFGEMHWKHRMTAGLRQTEHGTQLFQTPGGNYKSSTMMRNADLEFGTNGEVHGTVRVSMTGSQALRWRQRVLSTDESQVKKEFEEAIQEQMPPGVEVKTNHFLALTEYDSVLMAVLDVTGSMGTATSKRVFVPALFFEAGSKPLFVESRRTAPVDLDYPYAVRDVVLIRLPQNLVVESTPKDAVVPLPQRALYQTTFKQSPGQISSERFFALGEVMYPVDEYAGLKDFYQKVNAKDQEQLVLQPSPGGATPSTGGGGR